MNTKAIYATILILVTIIISLIVYTVNQKQDLKRTATAYQSLMDTVSTYKTKSGKLISERQATEISLSELKKMNKSLYTEITKMEKETKQKGKSFTSVGVSSTKIIVDTFDVTIADNEIGILSDYQDSVLSINTLGNIKLEVKDQVICVKDYKFTNSFQVTNLKINVLTGIKGGNIFKDGKYVTAVKINDNRFMVDSIFTWSEPPKQRSVRIRPGLMAGVIYDPWDNEVKLGLSAGLGIVFGK